MKAIILAGGFGTRLRPLTYNIPKPIIPVANRPFICHQIEHLKRHGVDEVIILVHYLPAKIQKILEGEKLGVKIRYCHERQPLGTAGAVKFAEKYFKDEELIIVFNGDILTELNLQKVVKFHKENKVKVTITLTQVEDPTNFGMVLIDKENRVTKFLEKPSWEDAVADTINAGIYVIDPSIFNLVPKNSSFSFERDLFPLLLEKGERMLGFVSSNYWIDIGSPEKYLLVHEAILRGEVSVRIFGTRNPGSIWVRESLKCSPSAKIYGPSIIGKNVHIGDHTMIKEYSVIGDNVKIEKNCQIERTVILSGTEIGSSVQLNQAIIGKNVKIEDYVTTAPLAVIADNSRLKKGARL